MASYTIELKLHQYCCKNEKSRKLLYVRKRRYDELNKCIPIEKYFISCKRCAFSLICRK
jgi:hypothetical protein